MTGFGAFGLPQMLLKALAEAGYNTPTPIQAAAIPELMKGRDMLALAQTGTGKTAAFTLPVMAVLSRAHGSRQPKSARALILAPTRELAIQIHDNIRVYSRHSHLRSTVIVGGVSMNNQVKELAGGVDLLVATPGRLLDHLMQKTVRIDTVSHLVLDEADRMLDMGFIRDIKKIIAALPGKRHSMLFSATMPGEIEELGRFILHQPARIDLSPPKRTAENIEQRVHFVPTAEKRPLLVSLLKDAAMSRVIVFTRTKHIANRIAEFLGKNRIEADAIHGNKSQNARQRALTRFKAGEIRVLVATDIAARGIDVDEISHVVNFDLPNEAESYVHRIGRTARAGSNGVAISFCDATENDYLRDIEKLTKQKLTVAGGEQLPSEPKAPRDYAKKRPFQGGHKRSGGDGAKAHGPKAQGKPREASEGGEKRTDHKGEHRPHGKPNHRGGKPQSAGRGGENRSVARRSGAHHGQGKAQGGRPRSKQPN
jgi:ATP-dependent RNA helicase RhlE